MSDQGPTNPVTGIPVNSTSDSFASKDRARLNLEQMILDALNTADDEMAKAIMAKGKLSFYIDHGTKSDDTFKNESTQDSDVATSGRPKLVSQEFDSKSYFADKTEEQTSLRQAQKRETLSKFRPVHDPSELSGTVASSEQTALGKIKISCNEYLDSLGRRSKQKADTSLENCDEHDEDWALKDRG